MKFLNIFIILSISYISLSAQIPHRYTDSLFVAEQTHVDQVYANAPELNTPYTGENNTYSAQLKMHIFQPQGDDLTKRPVLLCIHGGGFVSGNKEHDDMLTFCQVFAEKGYVTATMQYRLGMNMASTTSSERSVYRGIQDGRAAIRYLKSQHETLGIDTNHVFMIGSSAGAFVGLNNIFLNTNTERPASTYQISNFPPTTDDGPDLGGFDAIENQYKHGAHPDAMIGLWGAIKHTNLIEEGDEQIPVFLIHGTADQIVPFDVGSPFQAPTLAATYGSNPISQKLTTFDYPHETYFVENEGHEFYGVTNGNWDPAPNAYWYIVVEKSTNFLFNQHKPEATFSSAINDNTVQFTDESYENITGWHWDFGDGNFSDLQNPEHQYSEDGNYQVMLTVQNEIASWDTISQNITITTTGILGQNTAQSEKYKLYSCYPNPFNPKTKISYDLAKSGTVNITVFNSNGQLIQTLINTIQSAGHHEIQWDASDFSSGIYFYKIQSENFSAVQKMMLIK